MAQLIKHGGLQRAKLMPFRFNKAEAGLNISSCQRSVGFGLSLAMFFSSQLCHPEAAKAQGAMSLGPPGLVRYSPPGVDLDPGIMQSTSPYAGGSGMTVPGLDPQGMSMPQMGVPGPGMGPQGASIPGSPPALSLPGGATPGTVSSAQSQAAGGAVPPAGFAGLRSRSGINPADLPTSPNDPRVQKMMGMVPKFIPDFFRQLQANQLPSGSVLTGILDGDISSNKSKPGEVFVIRLEDGFVSNGVEVVPKQSKILGTITQVQSSKMLKGGQTGNLTIALQTLVFPDGRTCPFWGFIQHNPLDDPINQTVDAKTKALSYARYGYGMAGYFTRKLGYNLTAPHFGQEMHLKKGEVLPIRTNRSIDLSHMTPPSSQIPMPPGAVPSNLPMSGIPGMPALPGPRMQGIGMPGPGMSGQMPGLIPCDAPAIGSPGAIMPGPTAHAPNFVPGLSAPFVPEGLAGPSAPGMSSFPSMNAASVPAGAFAPSLRDPDPF